MDYEKHILSRFKLLKGRKLNYSEIWGKAGPSNKFNYHLKKLVSEEILSKGVGGYLLTPKGLHLISQLESKDSEKKERPIVCVWILGVDKKERVLVNRRTIQPFAGYVGIPGGKVEFGRSIREKAAEEFKEETGLEGDLELRLIANYVTVDSASGSVVHHVTAFTYLARNLRGDLKRNDREGINFFVSPADLKKKGKYRKYPDMDYDLDIILSRTKGPLFQEAVRTLDKGDFTGIIFK